MRRRQQRFPAWPLLVSLTVHGLFLFMIASDLATQPLRATPAVLQARWRALPPTKAVASAPLPESHRPLPWRPGKPASKRASQPPGRSQARAQDASSPAAAPAASEAIAPGPAESLGADDLRAYRFALAAAARRFRPSLALARERGREGAVVIGVALAAPAPPTVVLVKSSGDRILDAQALEMMQQAVGALAVPETLSRQRLRVDLHLEFRPDE